MRLINFEKFFILFVIIELCNCQNFGTEINYSMIIAGLCLAMGFLIAAFMAITFLIFEK
jgi:hypothetical protein